VQSCSSCEQANEDCNLPEHATPYSGPKKASEITNQDILPWATPIDWQKIDLWLADASTLIVLGKHPFTYIFPEPEEEPTSEHFLVIATGRLSSDSGPQDFQRLLAAMPRTAHRYDIALAGGHLLPHQEGIRPTPVMRQVSNFASPFPVKANLDKFLMAFVRQGTRAIPTALGNGLADPFLIGFVNLIRHFTRQGNPNRPVEIHHLLLGIAGFSVGMTNWGNRHAGYFKFLLDADQRNGDHHFEDNTYVVVVVEPHVVDGIAAHALHHPLRSNAYHGYSGALRAQKTSITTNISQANMSQSTSCGAWLTDYTSGMSTPLALGQFLVQLTTMLTGTTTNATMIS
jgi:hypothetical protein